MSGITWNAAALDRLFNSPDGPVAKMLLRKAVTVQRVAKRLCLVKTGRLRASIVFALSRDALGLFVRIGTDVIYAIYVEFGTWRMAARPFLRPALSAARGGAAA